MRPALAIFGLLLSLGGLCAHEGRPVYIEVTEQSGGLYSLRWKIPPVLRNSDLPMIRMDDLNCNIKAGIQKPSLIGQHLYQCTKHPEAIALYYPDANPALSTLIVIKSKSGGDLSTLAPPGVSEIPLPAQRTTLAVGRDYGLEGIRHILEGYDHLLFVLCLMLIAKTPRRVVFTVTGFTAGHSVTLAAAALDHLSLPPSIVEPLIAFSILLLAVEALKDHTGTLTSRYPASIAVGFGLLHGLGFAGALSQIGLPEGHQTTALLFFNLGVEAGQLLFVAGLFALIVGAKHLWAAGPELYAKRAKALALYPAGVIAAYWTIERLTGALV